MFKSAVTDGRSLTIGHVVVGRGAVNVVHAPQLTRRRFLRVRLSSFFGLSSGGRQTTVGRGNLSHGRSS